MDESDLRAVLLRVKQRVTTSLLIVEDARNVIEGATVRAHRSLIFDEFFLLPQYDSEEGTVLP